MINYTKGKKELENWIVEDQEFDIRYLGKTEAIMALGNGYLGIRSTHEEDYLEQTRDFFVSGTFNKSTEEEVTELPNLPDVINVNFTIDGKRFSLESGKVENYSKQLNIYTGELTRSFDWTSEDGKTLSFEFKRFVSQDNLHLIGSKVKVTSKSDVTISINTGINGQLTNTGAMHLTDGVKRIYDGSTLSYQLETIESKIQMVLNSAHSLKLNDSVLDSKPRMDMDRRKVNIIYSMDLKSGDVVELEKLSNIYTMRDKWHQDKTYDQLINESLEDTKACIEKGYDQLFIESAASFKAHWDRVDMTIDSEEAFDQLAIRFAQYHLKVMTPGHDERMGIGAKGLSGEGYKGHSFWDTEVFILPYYIMTMPEVAKSLLTYRYHGLVGARQKAKDNGYEGAMYPWEAAWIDDGEVTPVWGAVDIVTGKSTKIWSGFIEQHITSDIVYAVYTYYKLTDDQDFMDQYGYEMILDTAIFWSSRFEWDEERQVFGINNVIGPDEYKEHVNNNAFTNYMAKFTIDLALEYYQKLEDKNPELLKSLNEKLGFDERKEKIEERLSKLYLPIPREDGVIPQDDTYLEKAIIDLTKYKNQSHVGSLFQDYNLDQVNNIQVSKQADIMILFYLRESLFSKEVKEANWNYYEPKTLHDSSLSLSTHSIIASDIHDYDLSYDLFRRATHIDLGPNMKTSDHGIHAASLGGIWQCIVNGFVGLRLVGEHVRIEPNLPKAWKSVKLPINLLGIETVITVTKEAVEFDLKDEEVLKVEFKGEMIEVTGQTVLSIE